MRHCPQHSDLQWSFFTVTVKVLKLFWESYYAKVTFKSLPDEQMPRQRKIYSVLGVLNVSVYSVYGILASVFGFIRTMSFSTMAAYKNQLGNFLNS